MGNVNRTNPQLKSIDKTIIIEETKTLELNELVVFPHGYDGLHIWEGVGIGGLAVLKYTECSKCVLSDYNSSIVENIKLNCKKNGYPETEVLKLDWK
jgi:tRNA G26 N,N-dimethylase Trm1